MSAVLDIDILSAGWADIKSILQKVGEIYFVDIKIDNISSIDDWQWTGKAAIEYDDISETLSSGKIIVIEASAEGYENLGVYIRRAGQKYNYGFWIGTEKHPEMDSNEITAENRAHYEFLTDSIIEIFKDLHIEFMACAVGIETMIKDSEELEETISKSKNVAAWIVDRKYAPSSESIFRRNNGRRIVYKVF